MNLRSMFIASLVLAGLVLPASTVIAQSPVNAQWIWFDAGDPLQAAPAGKVWFRREVRASDPSTGIVRIAADDRFVLWVNGQRIGEGGGEQGYTFNLNGIVDRGPNVICVEAENKAGRAGLLVDGEVRSQGGGSISFDSGPEWVATLTEPAAEWLAPKFDTAMWKPAKALGPHEKSHWKAIVFGASYRERYQLAPGFEVTRIAEPQLVGSLVNMTWGNRGRIIASRERGPILSVIDADGDGIFENVVEFSSTVKNCQGLCMVGDDLFAVGDGPQGAGMYRLTDANRDDEAESVEHLYKHKGGMGEHGPHAVVYGPDGQFYHNAGNHSWITATPEPNSPIRSYYEGDLLKPRFEDPNGHAAGIPAPGGTIWRFSPDAKKWWLVTNGFRNEYDFAINAAGEIFSFDSDMEWEVGMPFYKPVRVMHCVPGADFGWRSNAGKWPSYYFDSLPATTDIGRGSPTGVTFYEHTQYPEKYRGAFVACDWSLGRIIVVPLRPQGATYAGQWENLISGNPLNASDVEVDQNGSVVFCTGGRGTEGGIYRVDYVGTNRSQDARSRTAKATYDTLESLLDMPQMQANWAREAALRVKEKVGGQWEAKLVEVVKSGRGDHQVRALTLLAQLGPKPTSELLIQLASDDDAAVRAFAAHLLGEHSSPQVAAALTKLLGDKDAFVQRRACEAFLQSGLEPPVGSMVQLLGSDDRWLRYSARLSLERIPVDKWKDEILQSGNQRVLVHGLLALHRLGAEGTTPTFVFAVSTLAWKLGLANRDGALESLRLLELSLTQSKELGLTETEARTLLEAFHSRTESPVTNELTTQIDAERARILAYLQVPGAAAKLVDALESASSHEQQIHYALVSSYLNAGWTYDLKRRVLNWYDKTADWEGGHSFNRYLENIITAHLARVMPEERQQLLLTWHERPHATGLILRISKPEQVADYENTISTLVGDLEARPLAGKESTVALVIDALGKSRSAQSQALLRKLFEEHPDRREQLARTIAQTPNAENWPYLVRTLQFGDNTTLQLALRALRDVDQKATKPAELHGAILAGLKLGNQGGMGAVAVLERWTGSKPPGGLDAAKSLAHYQQWYREKYPNEPAPELPAVDPTKSKFTFDQLFNYLERDPQAQNGDPARGKLALTKANCLKCHKLGKDGEGVGPDLTALRRRFQRKEIIEALVYPSLVVSDQYKSVTIQTTDGLIHTGMPAQQPDQTKVVLLLSDATRIEIPKSKIEVQEPSKISVMPEGVLKDLSLADIADLFAYLETTKSGGETVAAGP